MKQKDIKEMSNEALIIAFSDVTVLQTKEVNFGRGYTTEQSRKELKWIVSEISKRFEMSQETILEGISK
ncbi:hypothetical protein ABEO76_21955 [Bacillus anthracis]|uniref:hypothetical protein n=1 Tax=Bacillus anthracis TaxID=1392 RepID=UPI003D1D116B